MEDSNPLVEELTGLVKSAQEALNEIHKNEQELDEFVQMVKKNKLEGKEIFQSLENLSKYIFDMKVTHQKMMSTMLDIKSQLDPQSKNENQLLKQNFFRL